MFTPASTAHPMSKIRCCTIKVLILSITAARAVSAGSLPGRLVICDVVVVTTSMQSQGQ